MLGLFFSKQPDPSWLICLVMVGLKAQYPGALHLSPANLQPGLKRRILVQAIQRLAEERVITYSIFIPSTSEFRDVRLTEEGLAVLSRVPHRGGQVLSERLEAALTSGNVALVRLVVEELLAECAGGSGEESDL